MMVRWLLACALALPLAAQVSARQGSETENAPGEFTSPMVLELPLEKLGKEDPAGLYTFTEQQKFVCEDVSLPLVVVRKVIDPKAKRVTLKIESSVYVRPSYDRKVTLRYTVLSDGQPLPGVSDQEISAKEKKYRTDRSSLDLPLEAFERMMKGEAKGVLKVVLRVTPDR